MSIEVNVAFGAPVSIQSPLTPRPVPISMMLDAELAAATTASWAPVAGETGSTPISIECRRSAAMSSRSSPNSSANLQLESLSDTVVLLVQQRRAGVVPLGTGAPHHSSAHVCHGTLRTG